MDFGTCVAAKVDEIGYITHAENLGYSRENVGLRRLDTAGRGLIKTMVCNRLAGAGSPAVRG